MKIRSQSAFTLIEMLVVISIIAVLAAFAVPALTSALTKGQMTGTMNNGRQLYLAAQQMALDGSANSDPNLGWPADVGDTTLQLYMSRLVKNDYLKPGDVAKLLSGPGSSVTATPDAATPPGVVLGGTKAALKVYPVAEANASNAVFCVSANYVYGSDLTAANAGVPNNPFGDKGFIVQRKGGDASILRKTDAKIAAGGTAADIATFESKVGVKPDGTSTAGEPSGVLVYP